MRTIGIRSELIQTYLKYLPPGFADEHVDCDQKLHEYNKHKRCFTKGTKFPVPNDEKWWSMVNMYRARMMKLHPKPETDRLIAQALEAEQDIVRLKNLLHLKEHFGHKERHQYYARQALATVHFKQKLARRTIANPMYAHAAIWNGRQEKVQAMLHQTRQRDVARILTVAANAATTMPLKYLRCGMRWEASMQNNGSMYYATKIKSSILWTFSCTTFPNAF